MQKTVTWEYRDQPAEGVTVLSRIEVVVDVSDGGDEIAAAKQKALGATLDLSVPVNDRFGECSSFEIKV